MAEREKKQHPVTTWVGDTTIKKIEAIMDREDRPRSVVIRRLVEEALRKRQPRP